jgi:hypothetical protein
MKKWYQSKTIWFFALSLLVAIAGMFGFGDFHPSADQAEIIGVVVAIAGILLRIISHQGIDL